MAKVEATTMML